MVLAEEVAAAEEFRELLTLGKPPLVDASCITAAWTELLSLVEF